MRGRRGKVWWSRGVRSSDELDEPCKPDDMGIVGTVDSVYKGTASGADGVAGRRRV